MPQIAPMNWTPFLIPTLLLILNLKFNTTNPPKPNTHPNTTTKMKMMKW